MPRFLSPILSIACVAACVAVPTTARASAAELSVDVCIYGGTPAGVVAAVAAKQEGCSVVIIEPSRWLGGILGAGLKPMQDCPEPRAVGGLTNSVVFLLGEDPPAIRAAFAAWVQRDQIPVIYEHRLRSAEKSGDGLVRIHVEQAPPDKHGVPPSAGRPGTSRAIKARIFIDASYEGDLMAAAGVRYAFGREPRAAFEEQPAGVNSPTNWTPIDPYVRPGDPSSGLLPLVDPDHGKPLGAGDDYTQAYNFRYYVTTDPARRASLTPPPGYSPAQYELVGRYVDYLKSETAGDPAKLMQRLSGMFPGWRNRGDYNYQRASLISISPLGVSRFYQDGDWATRARIWQQHIDYLRGLHHFLSTDPRVPEEFRRKTAELGLDRTMHPDTDGWPNQLYVRISRRLVGDYVLSHSDVLNRTTVPDSVGLALYGVDTYPVRRYAARDPKTGVLGVATEGNMFIGGARGTGRPYGVPYRAIVPKAAECSNLIVPVCFSATYIAYASARMEPVFCVLGESAGVAAAHAIRARKPVQHIDIPQLQARLRERGQVLDWPVDQP